MRIDRPADWWLARARREGDYLIGAGRPDDVSAPQEALVEPSQERLAFGRFVSLMRRKKGLSLRRLAETAHVEENELAIIEGTDAYSPDPRTIYCLARTFSVPAKSLMQLSGLTVANDTGLKAEAVRFAARSESLKDFTPELSSVLEAFVAVLSEMDADAIDEERPTQTDDGGRHRPPGGEGPSRPRKP